MSDRAIPTRAPLSIPALLALTLAVSALLGASPSPLGAAEPHAILARGFEPDQIYDFNDIDHVNLFNGNLVVTIPLGQRYPVNAGFEYGFSLVYNSQIWDYVIDCPGNGVDELGEPGAPSLFITDPASASAACGGGSPPQKALRGIPNPKSNAGTGWRLTLGELYDANSPLVPEGHWTFVGRDGAERQFQIAEGASGGFPRFTRDDSNLRLNDTGTSPACTTVSGTCMTVERPDGVTYAFEATATLAGWRLRRIEDRFGNGVSVTYSSGLWTVQDSTGRTHTVAFDGDGILSSLSLAAFGDTTADYGFDTEASPPTLPGCPHDFDLPGISEIRTLTRLTGITLPDGSEYDLQYVEDDGSTGACTYFEGRLRSLTLPTGGTISYEYGSYLYPIKPCDPPPVRSGGSPSDHFMAQWGVTRRVAHDIGGALLAETRYVSGGPSAAPTRQSYTTSEGAVCIQPRTTFTDVYEKADQGRYKLTRHFFAVAQSQGGPGSPTDPDRLPGETFRYGLPVDHLSSDVGLALDEENPNRFRSSMVFDCPSSQPSTESYGPNCAVSDSAGCWPAEAWHLRIPTSCYDANKDGDANDRFLFADEVRGLRDVYLEHEAGGAHYCDGNLTTNPDCDLANWRIKTDRTYFYDSPGNHWVKTERSGFDGYGGYRTTVSSSNSPDSRRRTTFVDYQPEVTPDVWLLGLVDERKVTEDGQTSRETYAHDPMRDYFLESRTTHRSDGNLVATFENDGFGNVETETYSGGDSGQRGYTIKNQFSSGTLSHSRHVDGTRTVLQTVDADIDLNTGLPWKSRDASGLETVYTFDAMGRLTDLEQQGTLAEAATGYVYTPADPTASGDKRASVTVTRGDTTASIYFDGLGRAQEERTTLPGGTTNRRFTIFTPMSQVRSVTTLHPLGSAGSARKTETDYDIFGRPTEIRNPDDDPDAGKDSRTTFFYEGIFKTVRRIHRVETSDGPRRLQTRFFHDHQGRLVTVEDTELSDSGTGADLKLRTRYEYDEGSRLVRVIQGGGAQERTFDYDAAGLLTKECHPELANGCITYGGFDARGNPARLRYTQSGGAAFGLDYVRDAAGRLTQVKSAADGRMLKEFIYNNFYDADEAPAPSEGNGKLYQAKRHNDFGSLDLVATTTHTYGGIGGRLSRRVDATGGDGTVPRVRFTTDFVYDTLGNLSQVTYPTCEQAGCENEPPNRTVTRGFTRGLLTHVGTPTDADRYASLAYHPNLTLAQVLHGNGVRDVTSQDPHQMPRPGAVEVRKGAGAGVGALWQAAYAYDGSGNVASRQTSEYRDDGSLVYAGTDLFDYDAAFNRLVSATIHYPAGTGGTSNRRSFSYDAFGNLLSIGGDASRSFSTDPDTNRLKAPFTYDAAGNLTSQPDASSTPTSLQQWYYSYDPFHMMTRAFRSAGSITRQYVYTADDERLAVITPSRELWTLRGTDAQVLRDVEYVSTGWNWLEDYVHRGTGLLASESDTGTGTETKHYHLDHLGSPRLVTGSSKQVLARHVYAPYGEELTAPLQDETRMKFTGHERDRMDVTDPAGDLDYMHARYYSGNMGRFLSVDPENRYEPLRAPQLWNRYAYAIGNPMKYEDPDGRDVVVAKGLQKKVAKAYARSATFRKTYDSLNQDRGILVKVRGGLMSSSGVEATTVVEERVDVVIDGQRTSHARVTLTTVPPGVSASTIGHELFHSTELRENSDITQAEGYRPSGSGKSGHAETQPAIDAGRLIAAEYRDSGDDIELTQEVLGEIFEASNANPGCAQGSGSCPDPE